MEFLKKLKTFGIVKIVGIVFSGLIVLTLIITVAGMALNPRSQSTTVGMDSNSSGMMYGLGGSVGGYSEISAPTSLSTRNVVQKSVPQNDTQTAGDDAEAYEVTEYSATIQTRKLDNVCGRIAELKVLDYVIFESANLRNDSCRYTFKVKTDHKDEILDIIKSLKPRYLDENSYTIKQQVDDFTSEIDILNKKKVSIDETLGKAILAYDEVTNLAVQTKDVESLTKIIDNKLQLINRLAEERINVNAQLERLKREKTNQLDRLDYNYFKIYVSENKFIDKQDLKDSWRDAVRSFIESVNDLIQNVTINFLILVVWVIQYVFYFFVLLIVVKYGWRLVKYVWKR